MKIKKVLSLSLLFVLSLVMVSCQNGGSSNSGYDGREFDISVNQDKSLKAKIKKIGINYELTISGSGEALSYQKKELVPWNAISKRITKVTIEEGIENIGDYYFHTATLTEYFIPSTITQVEKNSFNAGSKVYCYATGSITVDADYNLYMYSQTKPSINDKYWRMIGTTPVIWNVQKMLFIGNSFTYFPSSAGFTTANPGVCSILNSIGTSLGLDLEVDFVVQGSHTLKKFANANDEFGSVVDQKLRAASDYDYVILQEHSTTPVNDYNSFNSGVTSLANKVEQTQNDCKVYLYATWGFPSAVSSNSIFSSISVMEGLLRNAYHKCATENGLKVTDVGKAFTYVYENHNDISLYGSDEKHQSYAGAYLSASMHLSSMLGVDIREATFNGDLTPTVASTLRNVAYDLSFN